MPRKENSATTSGKRLVFIVLLIAFISALLVIGFSAARQPEKTVALEGTYLPESKAIQDFSLTDHHGKPFTLAALKGHWTLLFFGFTNCGMACPTTMAALNDMMKQLAPVLPAAALPDVVMVSVDPDRDSLERLDEYVNAFNPRFVGVRGDMVAIETLQKELHLVSVKVQTHGGKDYTVSHSTEILVFNPEGKLQAMLSSPHKAEQLAQDFKAVLAASAS